MVLFGQIVVGPPGCGKTTYCMGMQMFIEAVGRNCKIVNLDFANDNLPYTPAIDVRELVSLEVLRLFTFVYLLIYVQKLRLKSVLCISYKIYCFYSYCKNLPRNEFPSVVTFTIKYTCSQRSELGLIIFYTIRIRGLWRNSSSVRMED